MKRWAVGLLLVLALGQEAALHGHPIRNRLAMAQVSLRLHGKVDRYTRLGFGDRRIWSAALEQKRDLYVYLPPGYDPHKHYPLILWLHGWAEDETIFLRDVVAQLDNAMADGRLPAAIIAAPDGSLRGLDCLLSPGSFFLNTQAGRFEDFLIQDVYGFVMAHYPICPEPEAHIILGISGGGGAAFNKVFKYPQLFRTAVGVFPAVNNRWQDCTGDHRANFNPCCWGWRTDFDRRRSVEGRFLFIPVRLGRIIDPLYPRNDPEGTVAGISSENPIELLETCNVQPGQFNLYVGYGGRDQFNIDAQVESFLWCCRQRGIEVAVGYVPNGKHDARTALKLFPGMLDFMRPILLPFSPPSGANIISCEPDDDGVEISVPTLPSPPPEEDRASEPAKGSKSAPPSKSTKP